MKVMLNTTGISTHTIKFYVALHTKSGFRNQLNFMFMLENTCPATENYQSKQDFECLTTTLNTPTFFACFSSQESLQCFLVETSEIFLLSSHLQICIPIQTDTYVAGKVQLN